MYLKQTSSNKQEKIMNIQRHSRIEKIKKLSRYLYLFLTGLFYVNGAVFLGVAVFTFFGSSSNFTNNYDNTTFTLSDLKYWQKILLAIHFSIFPLLILKIIHHARHLVYHFSIGDIFNVDSIQQARKVLITGLLIYGYYLISLFSVWVYKLTQGAMPNITVDGNYLLGFTGFGILTVLLWALEIGADLNKESELTI
jgi:hypothetical protein